MVRCLDGVSNVIVQDSVMYDKVIAELKPDYVIHGDNWLEGPTKAIRDNVQKALSSYGGTIVDVPYTRNELVHHMDERVKAQLAMPEFRRARLRRMLTLRPVVKAIEVHSGLTGLLAEKPWSNTTVNLTSSMRCGLVPCVIRRPRVNLTLNSLI